MWTLAKSLLLSLLLSLPAHAYVSGSLKSHSHTSTSQGGTLTSYARMSATNTWSGAQTFASSLTAVHMTATQYSSAPAVFTSSLTLTAIATPASPGPWRIWADTTLGKLAYSDASGNVVAVDPEYHVITSYFAPAANNSGYTSVIHSSSGTWFSTTESVVRHAFGMKGTIIAMDCNSAASGARTWTMRKNGASAGLSCSTTANEVCRATGSVSVVATDELTFEVTGAYEGTAKKIYGCRFIFQPGVQ